MRWGVTLPLLVFPIAATLPSSISCGTDVRDTQDEGTDIAVRDASPFVLTSLSDTCDVSTLTGQAVLDLMKPEYDATLMYSPVLGVHRRHSRSWSRIRTARSSAIPQ